MQDLADLEGRGLPAVGVVSAEFVATALGEFAVLDFEPAVVFVPPPIQSRTYEELESLAQAALASILDGMTAPG